LNNILEDSGKMFEEDLTPEFYPGVPFKDWECGYCSYNSICPSTLRDKKKR
jgi:CRISPR/Cas system-associated exonuclease Cas4 (RecB family)